jgi:uncharacterized membrane protein
VLASSLFNGMMALSSVTLKWVQIRAFRLGLVLGVLGQGNLLNIKISRYKSIKMKLHIGI